MIDGGRQLSNWIAKLRRLETVNESAIPRVAEEIKKQLLEAARRQRGPDGQPWARTEDGRKALRNLASELSVKVVRGAVVVRLDGRYARHHLGAVKGAKKRSMIPTGKFPDPMIRAIREVVEAEYAKIMGGRQ